MRLDWLARGPQRLPYPNLPIARITLLWQSNLGSWACKASTLLGQEVIVFNLIYFILNVFRIFILNCH